MTAPDRPRVDFRDLTHGQQNRLVGLQVLVVGGVVDVVVALARQVRGRRGVQVGPTLVSLALALVLPPVGRWAARRGGRTGAVVVVGAGAAAVLAPAAAAAAPRTVVGSGNPLTSLAWSAVLRVAASLATILQVVRSLPATRARLAEQQLSGG